jgi:signal transduction histidine kinase
LQVDSASYLNESALLNTSVSHVSAPRHLFELSRPRNRVLEVGLRQASSKNVSQILYFRDVSQATEVDRMKSEFLSTAAHELRTPMASIYGFAELLLTHDYDERTRREMLQTVHAQSELIVSIVNELLDLARIEARRGKDFVIERTSVEALIASAIAGLKSAPADTTAVIVPGAEGMMVKVDRTKIHQAISNVLSNAYKYSLGSGPVEVAVVSDSEGSRPAVGIVVRDRGMGMTDDQLSRVFERFYRADTAGTIPGTGLGMSIVKEIIDLHGGRVEVHSKPGEGTTVTLWLPRA